MSMFISSYFYSSAFAPSTNRSAFVIQHASMHVLKFSTLTSHLNSAYTMDEDSAIMLVEIKFAYLE